MIWGPWCVNNTGHRYGEFGFSQRMVFTQQVWKTWGRQAMNPKTGTVGLTTLMVWLLTRDIWEITGIERARLSEVSNCYANFRKTKRLILLALLVAQTVKRLPAMQETRVRSLDQEDPLEKAMATHSSTLAWKIPWTEKPGRLQSMGSQRVRHDWATPLSLYLEVWVLLKRLKHQQKQVWNACPQSDPMLGTSVIN